jgi:hypothetical protein
MNHVSTLRLHQLRLGEIEGEDAGRIRAHLADCDACARRFDTQAQARADFVRAPVPAYVTPPVTWATRLRALWKWPVLLVPVLAALFLVVRPPEDEVRTKGGVPVLEAWVESGESARPVYVGERVRPGTRVQLKFDAGRRRFVTLAGRDGEGTVEVYATVPAEGPGLKTAPFALTLDDSAGDQEFFAVLTDVKPDPDRVVEALSAEPVRMERSDIASVVLRKE